MLLLKDKLTFRCETEDEAKELVENYKQRGKTENFYVNKFSYQLKEKKAKGEIIDSCYEVSCELVYNTIWGELG